MFMSSRFVMAMFAKSVSVVEAEQSFSQKSLLLFLHKATYLSNRAFVIEK